MLFYSAFSHLYLHFIPTRILEDFQGCKRYEGEKEHRLNVRYSVVKTRAAANAAHVRLQCVPQGLQMGLDRLWIER